MKSPWKSLFNGLEIVSSVGVVLAEIALAVLLILVFHEVVARYVFNNPTLYSVEISEYLLIFIAFMAAGWVMKNNGHVRMSSVISLMPLRMRQFADVFTSIIVFCFCAILVWQGMKSSLMAFTGGLPFKFSAQCPSMDSLCYNSTRLPDSCAADDRSNWKYDCRPDDKKTIIAQQGDSVDSVTITIIVLSGFLTLLFLGMPVFGALGSSSVLGILLIQGVRGLGAVPGVIYDRLAVFPLVAVPLFILMGEIIFHSGIGSQIFTATNRWFNRLPGSMGIASVAACAIFSALCGVSVAGAATIGSFRHP